VEKRHKKTTWISPKLAIPVPGATTAGMGQKSIKDRWIQAIPVPTRQPLWVLTDTSLTPAHSPLLQEFDKHRLYCLYRVSMKIGYSVNIMLLLVLIKIQSHFPLEIQI